MIYLAYCWLTRDSLLLTRCLSVIFLGDKNHVSLLATFFLAPNMMVG